MKNEHGGKTTLIDEKQINRHYQKKIFLSVSVDMANNANIHGDHGYLRYIGQKH